MHEPLEDFVAQHREAFDVREPDPRLWLKVDAGTPQRRFAPGRSWLRIAAALALIFGGFSAGLHFLGGGAAGVDGDARAMVRDIRETEQYYRQVLDSRYEEIRPYLAADPGTRVLLDTEMEELDLAFDELKNDLKDNGANPEVLEAMILNYRVKLELLEDLLGQIKEKENQNEENKERVSL
ncbi:MAG: hypothetical protein R2751_19210 [Bacteroidales bacterium]